MKISSAENICRLQNRLFYIETDGSLVLTGIAMVMYYHLKQTKTVLSLRNKKMIGAI